MWPARDQAGRRPQPGRNQAGQTAPATEEEEVMPDLPLAGRVALVAHHHDPSAERRAGGRTGDRIGCGMLYW